MQNNQKRIISLSSNSAILGALLAIVGGFLDTYTFITRDGVFANAQTGNVVLLAIKLAHFDWRSSLLYIMPIIAFIAGVMVSEIVKIPRLREFLYSYRRSILLLECAVLFLVGWLPASVPNMVVTVLISFASSLQISTFNKLKNWPYNSTMITGSLRTASQAAYSAFIEHNQDAMKQCKSFSANILAFLLGALIGTLSTTYMGTTSIWVADGILLVAVVLYHRDKGYFRKTVPSNQDQHSFKKLG